MADQVENGNGKKRKINAFLIVGVILMFAGGGFVAPAKWIIETIGLVLGIAGFIKARKRK